MKSKTSLISIAIILSVGLITSMTAYANSGNTDMGPMSDSSTQSTMPMKGGMSGMGMGDMKGNCKNMMETHGHQSATTTTTKDASE